MRERLYISRVTLTGRDVVQPFTFKSYKEGEAFPEEEHALEGFPDHVRQFLQAMMDLAWERGLRPAQLEDQRNELKAVRDHLGDMRILAMREK